VREEIAALVQYRLEHADAALDDAKYLLDGNRSPQSVINRAYYAMFYAALALLQKAGKIPSKHAGVIGLFDTEFVVKGVFPRELSQDFHKAFELRQVSDYRVLQSPSREKAEETWGKAARFVRAVGDYLRGAEVSEG
jgi:uncharacterized protein (UPF0332 family)